MQTLNNISLLELIKRVMIDVDKEQSKILCEKNELFAIIMRTSRHKMECGKGNCCI